MNSEINTFVTEYFNLRIFVQLHLFKGIFKKTLQKYH
jgi:hypothetical protein